MKLSERFTKDHASMFEPAALARYQEWCEQFFPGRECRGVYSTLAASPKEVRGSVYAILSNSVIQVYVTSDPREQESASAHHVTIFPTKTINRLEINMRAKDLSCVVFGPGGSPLFVLETESPERRGPLTAFLAELAAALPGKGLESE